MDEVSEAEKQECAEEEKIRLWKDHNDLKETRPLLLVDMENGWNEAVRFDRDIQCKGYMAQECGDISPEMFHEFIYPYHRQVAEFFGLTCYACCEGIDEKWEWVKELPNLRRVSISQWSDMAKMSDYLKGDFIYSYKANSAHVTVPDMNEAVIRGELRRMFEKTRENHVEVVLKDLHSISNKPEQVIRWVQIAREELNRVY